jgi:multiple sugar transport system ATP-binding protein
VFVAAFMGSPAMNLVPGVIEDGQLRFAGVAVPAETVAGSTGRRGDVIVGVRPTDLLVADGGDLPRLRAELEVVERLGAESHVIFPVDSPRLSGAAAAAADEATEEGDATLLAEDNRARFTARIEGRKRFTAGETIELAVQPDTLHLFDPETGRALGYAEPTSGLTASSSSG